MAVARTHVERAAGLFPQQDHPQPDVEVGGEWVYQVFHVGHLQIVADMRVDVRTLRGNPY